MKTLSPVLFSSSTQSSAVVASRLPQSSLSSPVPASGEPRRFSFGISKSLPPSGGNRRASLGDCNNNISNNDSGNSNSKQPYEVGTIRTSNNNTYNNNARNNITINNQVILPQLFNKPTGSKQNHLYPSTYNNANNNIKKSKSTPSFQPDQQKLVNNPKRSKFYKSPTSVVFRERQRDLSSHILSTRHSRSSEHLPSMAPHSSKEANHQSKFIGVKPVANSVDFRNQEYSTASTKRHPITTVSTDATMVLNDIMPHPVNRQTLKSSSSFESAPKSYKQNYRNNDLSDRSTNIGVSQTNTDTFKLPNKTGNVLRRQPINTEAFATPKTIIIRVEVSKGTSVNVNGRTLHTKPPTENNNVVSGEGKRQSPEDLRKHISNNASQHVSDLKGIKPKLVRSRTFDVIDTKMHNLPVVDTEKAGHKHGRRSVDGRRRRPDGRRTF